MLPSNTSHMKTHVHQYDILHAGETPRKEDVSVANIKHKKGLEKDKQPQATSPFQWHGPKQCHCLVTKAQNVQECLTMLVPTC